MKIAIFGLGYWGSIYFDKLRKMDGVSEIFLVDNAPAIVKAYKPRPNDPPITTSIDPNYKYLFENEFNAAIIATPLHSHFQIAKFLLWEGISCLVEKPVVHTVDQHNKLLKLADENSCAFFPGLTYFFNPHLDKLREEQLVGKAIEYIRSERTNLGPVRTDVTCLLDLAVHDLTIATYVLGEKYTPEYISHNFVSDDYGSATLNVQWIDYKTLHSVNQSIYVSWNEPGKERKTKFVMQDKSVVVFDEMNLPKSKESAVYSGPDSLDIQLQHFFYRINDKKLPETHTASEKIVKLLEGI